MNEQNKNPPSGKGYIYILSNPSMANLYKVGLTTNSVNQRIQELNSTGVPRPFKLEKKYEIREDKLLSVERLAHKKLTVKGLHHGKEFFEGPIHLIEVEVEDSIFEISGETATDLIGLAFQRKIANDKKIKEEREFENTVQKRLEYENKRVDEKRASHIKLRKLEIKENTSFLDKYVWAPLAFLFFGAIAIGIMTTGPIGWIIVAFAGWWIYNEDNVKPERALVDDAERQHPYKTKEEIVRILNSEKTSKRQEVKGFVIKETVRNPSSQSHISVVTRPVEKSNQRVDLTSSRNSVVKRVADEIADLSKRDPGLWFECYQETKNLSNRNILYSRIREQYLLKKLKNSGHPINTHLDNNLLDSLPFMSSYEIDEAISKA